MAEIARTPGPCVILVTEESRKTAVLKYCNCVIPTEESANATNIVDPFRIGKRVRGWTRVVLWFKYRIVAGTITLSQCRREMNRLVMKVGGVECGVGSEE